MHVNSGVTFEFDRKSEKIKLKCGTGEENAALSVLSLFAERRYSETLNEKWRALASSESTGVNLDLQITKSSQLNSTKTLKLRSKITRLKISNYCYRWVCRWPKLNLHNKGEITERRLWRSKVTWAGSGSLMQKAGLVSESIKWYLRGEQLPFWLSEKSLRTPTLTFSLL